MGCTVNNTNPIKENPVIEITKLDDCKTIDDMGHSPWS